jgi:hypothetical protein
MNEISPLKLFDRDFYEYMFNNFLDPVSKLHLLPYITTFPVDLIDVEITCEQFQKIKAPIIGLYLNRFTVSIPITVKKIKGCGIKINDLPPYLESLNLENSFLNVKQLPETLKSLELTNITTSLILYRPFNLDTLWLKRVEFLDFQLPMKINATSIYIEDVQLQIDQLIGEKICLCNMETDIQPNIVCNKLEIYNVSELDMNNVYTKKFTSTKSVINQLPNGCEELDLAETFVSNFEPLTDVKSFIYSGEYSVSIPNFPSTISRIRINNAELGISN